MIRQGEYYFSREHVEAAKKYGGDIGQWNFRTLWNFLVIVAGLTKTQTEHLFKEGTRSR